MTEDDLHHLEMMGLLPPTWDEAVRPPLEWQQDVDYRARFRGSLLAGAIGDALGRPVEGRSAGTVAAHFAPVRDFRKWHGWRQGPIGTITDDTQLTMVVGDSLLANGEVDPEDLARRMVEWLPIGRGKGLATTAAVERLDEGVPWWYAGVESDGNGAAMRVAPIGLVYATRPDQLRRAAALSAVVTHIGPMAVAGAVAQALAVSLALDSRAGSLDVGAFLEAMAAGIDDVYDPGAPERREGATKTPVRLVEQLRRVPDLLGLSRREAFDRLYNGAFVLESLPAAIWCFLKSPEDAEEVLVTAVSGGRDADTVAAMAGALVGAYLGDSVLPRRWVDELEFADDLVTMADGLASLAGAPMP